MTSLNPALPNSIADRSDASDLMSRGIDVPVQTPAEKEIRETCTVELLKTDVRYFELASKTTDLHGAHMYWSPGRTSIPLGCVILQVEEPETSAQALGWVSRFEDAILQVDCSLSRIYLQEPNPVMELALIRAGYEQQAEVAFVGPATPPPTDTSVTLEQMKTEADLDRMAEIDAEIPVGPDGHAVDNETWSEIIRQKWRTGELSLYFIVDRDDICGTVGAMNAEHILRLKNLVVRPSHRTKGVGRGATLALWKLAFESGKRLATFAAPGGGGYATYKSAGLDPTKPQVEWCRKLTV